jgi:hypothetical protein
MHSMNLRYTKERIERFNKYNMDVDNTNNDDYYESYFMIGGLIILIGLLIIVTYI